MTETHVFVDEAIERMASEEDIPFGRAAMVLMATASLAMASALPPQLRKGLAAACSRWVAGHIDVEVSLAQLAQPCWSYLEAKHGNSTTVADRSDVAVRTLLCVLSDEVPEPDELEMTLDYFVSMVDRFDGVREVMGLV